MKKLLITMAILSSCGRKSDPQPTADSPDFDQILREQIERIIPLTTTCYGMASGQNPNNITHEPKCDIGDGVSQSGRIVMDATFPQRPEMLQAIVNSIDAQGQPFRNPSYVGKDNEDEFSRDQFLGLLEYTISTGDNATLSKVYNWAKSVNSLCLHPSDGRCKLTPGVSILAKQILGEFVSLVDITTQDAVMIGQASTIPLGYEAHLVARSVLIQHEIGKGTGGYRSAISTLSKRSPGNPFIAYVNAIVNGGDVTGIKIKLSQCMINWKQPQDSLAWDFQVCDGKRGLGLELVGLAQQLLKVGK